MTATELPGPPIDGPEVERWIVAHVAGATPPLTMRLITGGHSNRTYLVTGGDGQRFVLRCPPAHPVPAGTHDVVREHRILRALADSPVPAPRPLALCVDTDVSAAPFFVMSFAEGRVVASVADVDAVLPTPQLRHAAADGVVDALADLHRVDVDAVGLGDLGPREHFVDRQLRRMGRVWQQTRTRDLPLMDELARRLAASQPPQRHTGILHADYRLGNVMLDGAGRVTAMLDWELCTLGDVLADVAFLLDNWDLPTDRHRSVWMERPPTNAGGFPTRDALVARYAARTGFDVSGLGFHRALAYWKIAVIAEGIKRRAEHRAGIDGTPIDPEAHAHLERRVRDAAELAHEQLRLAEHAHP